MAKGWAYYSKNGGELYAVLAKEDADYEKQLDREGKNWAKLKLGADEDVPVDGSKVIRTVETGKDAQGNPKYEQKVVAR